MGFLGGRIANEETDMDKERLRQYIQDNFTVSGEAMRLIANIVGFVACQPDDEQPMLLCALLDGTIGIERAELLREANIQELE